MVDLNYPAGLSKEEVLFEKHAREDNQPSTSRGIHHEPALDAEKSSGLVTTDSASKIEQRGEPRRARTAASDRPSGYLQPSQSPLLPSDISDTGRVSNRSEVSQQRERVPSPVNRSQKPPRHSESGESSDSSRGKGRRRRGRCPTLPPPGQPGALDDPRRTGLSGAGVKWYLRYLEEGKTPETARQLVEQRPKNLPDQPCVASAAKRDQYRYRADRKRTAPAPATEQRSGKPTAEPAPAAKRRSGQITPQAPSAKRQRAHPPPHAVWPGERRGTPPPAAPRDNNGQQTSYSDAPQRLRG